MPPDTALHELSALCESALRGPQDDPRVQAVLDALPGPGERSQLPRGDRQYLAWPAAGVLLVFGDGRLAQASFHLQPQAGGAVFRGVLRGGLAAGDRLDRARAALGVPDSEDDGIEDGDPRRLPAWLRYRHGDAFLHIEAADGDTISLVALVQD